MFDNLAPLCSCGCQIKETLLYLYSYVIYVGTGLVGLEYKVNFKGVMEVKKTIEQDKELGDLFLI